MTTLAYQIPIERLTAGNEIIIPGFGPAEVYGVRFDGEGYLIQFCMDDRGGWDALDTHYVEAGQSVEHAYEGEPRYLRSKAAVTPEEWEAKFQADMKALPALIAQNHRAQLYGAVARALNVPALHSLREADVHPMAAE